MSKKGKSKKSKPVSVPKRQKKQPELPGMQDSALEDLESSAREYAEIRDQRMALNKQEKELKDSILSLMHKHGKSTYRHEDVEINIVPEGEKVKVKIGAKGEEEEPF